MNIVNKVVDWVIDLAQVLISRPTDESDHIRQVDCLKLTDMAEWFQQFKLTRGKDVPVVIDARSEFGQQLAEKLEEAGVIDTGLDLFEYCFIVGSFNKETNAFEHAVIYVADEIDQQLKEVFEGKGIIALQ